MLQGIVKENPSNRRKIIADGNLDVRKRMEGIENGNHVGKCDYFCINSLSNVINL